MTVTWFQLAYTMKETSPLLVGRLGSAVPLPELLVEDFKIELGREEHVTTDAKAASGLRKSPRRTTVGLAKDFFDQTIGKVNSWLESRGQPLPKHILVAEPLSLVGRDQDNEGWLPNYRRSVRRALAAKFEEVDFLPEPFAAFQYYRYGIRHPAVAENRKHVALVLDFGGGTFDASVIETKKTGDIREGGSSSKPLGAKSIAVGGFYINRLLLEEILFPSLQKAVEKGEVRKALTYFNANRNIDEETLATLAERQQTFFKNYKNLLQQIEKAKVAICNGVANWSLAADLSGLVPYQISVPTDPFDCHSLVVSGRLDAGKLRKIYEERIWKERLAEVVTATIKRASAELRGQEITVVLLSGGSANIRWLKPSA